MAKFRVIPRHLKSFLFHLCGSFWFVDLLRFAENFLHMMFSTPTEPYVVSPVIANALEKIMILHADHEQNQSTSTVRVAVSMPKSCTFIVRL